MNRDFQFTIGMLAATSLLFFGLAYSGGNEADASYSRMLDAQTRYEQEVSYLRKQCLRDIWSGARQRNEAKDIFNRNVLDKKNKLELELWRERGIIRKYREFRLEKG